MYKTLVSDNMIMPITFNVSYYLLIKLKYKITLNYY